jgi:hypothetical protein
MSPETKSTISENSTLLLIVVAGLLVAIFAWPQVRRMID